MDGGRAVKAIRCVSTGVMVAAGYLSREEALFWLGLTITVLQALFDFYKWYTDPARQPMKRVEGEAA